jgi:tRNA-binding protein
MILYYNREGIGDTLIVYLKEGGKQTVQTRNDVARIFDEATNETLGLNFFNASQFLEDQATGAVVANATLIELLNQKLTEAKLEPSLPVDVKPLIVTGYVCESKKHPDSDHMHVCQVDCGEETLQIVCGAPNIEQGQKVVVAKIGALMPNGTIIRPTVLRGVSSDGMICSARELALANAPQKRGILVLNSETTVGQDFDSLIAKEMHV